MKRNIWHWRQLKWILFFSLFIYWSTEFHIFHYILNMCFWVNYFFFNYIIKLLFIRNKSSLVYIVWNCADKRILYTIEQLWFLLLSTIWWGTNTTVMIVRQQIWMDLNSFGFVKCVQFAKPKNNKKFQSKMVRLCTYTVFVCCAESFLPTKLKSNLNFSNINQEHVKRRLQMNWAISQKLCNKSRN